MHNASKQIIKACTYILQALQGTGAVTESNTKSHLLENSAIRKASRIASERTDERNHFRGTFNPHFKLHFNRNILYFFLFHTCHRPLVLPMPICPPLSLGQGQGQHGVTAVSEAAAVH